MMCRERRAPLWQQLLKACAFGAAFGTAMTLAKRFRRPRYRILDGPLVAKWFEREMPL